MRTEHFNYLLEVARCHSINKASKVLHINQQHLSNIVTGIEEEFGTKIFERSNKGILLTKDGQIILERIQLMDEEYHKLTTLFKTNENNTHEKIHAHLKLYSVININPETLFVTVDRLNTLFPNVDILMFEESPRKIVDMVGQDPLTIGLISYVGTTSGIEGVKNGKIKYIPIYETSLVAIAAKNSHFISSNKTTSLKSLLKEDIVIYSPYDLEDNLHYRILASSGKPQIKYIVSNLNAFHRILNKGDCITIGCESQALHEEMRHFSSIPIRDNIKINIGLLINEEGENHPLVQQFIKLYKQTHV